MHLPGDPATVCPECYAAARGYVSDPNDDDWVTGYRHSFYWEMSSSTSDDTWWQIFDDVDRAAFDADERGEHAGDEREGEDMGEYDADGPYSEYGDDADDDGFVDS